MAKYIKSLSRAARQAKQSTLHNVAKPPSATSPTGKPAAAETARRKDRDAATLLRKVITLRAAKKAAGPDVVRERKAVYPEHLFAGMTPRQVKHLKKRPKDVETLRQMKVAAQLAGREAAEQLVDAKRDIRARQKAAAIVRATKALNVANV